MNKMLGRKKVYMWDRKDVKYEGGSPDYCEGKNTPWIGIGYYQTFPKNPAW